MAAIHAPHAPLENIFFGVQPALLIYKESFHPERPYPDDPGCASNHRTELHREVAGIPV
jgi:hypothetical protein